MTVAATMPRRQSSGAARECLGPGQAAAIASRPVAVGSSGRSGARRRDDGEAMTGRRDDGEAMTVAATMPRR
jgi:hypothetical protein